jgi:hypothetical protein
MVIKQSRTVTLEENLSEPYACPSLLTGGTSQVSEQEGSKTQQSPFMKKSAIQSKNGYPTKSNLHIQHNSHQNPKDIHHRD